MGNSTSSTVTDTYNEFNTNLTNIASKTTNNSSQIGLNSQKISIQTGVGSNIDCSPGGFVIGQSVLYDSSLQATFSASNTTELESLLQQALTQTANSTNQNTSGFLNTNIANSNSSNTTVQEQISNLISTNIDNIVTNSCTQSLSSTQNQTITILGNLKASNCDFSQSGQISLNCSCLSTAILNLASKDTVLTTAVNSGSSSNSVTSTGLLQDLGGLISSIFSGITGMEAVFAIGIILFIFIFIWGFVHLIRGFGSNKSNPSSSSSSPSSSSSSSPYPSSSFSSSKTVNSQSLPVANQNNNIKLST